MILTELEVMELMEIKRKELKEMVINELEFYTDGENYRFEKLDIVKKMISNINNLENVNEEIYKKMNLNRDFVTSFEFCQEFSIENQKLEELCENNKIENFKVGNLRYVKYPTIIKQGYVSQKLVLNNIYLNTKEIDGYYITLLFFEKEGELYLKKYINKIDPFEEGIESFIDIYCLKEFLSEGIINDINFYKINIEDKNFVDKINNKNFNTIKGYRSDSFRKLEKMIYNYFSENEVILENYLLNENDILFKYHEEVNGFNEIDTIKLTDYDKQLDLMDEEYKQINYSFVKIPEHEIDVKGNLGRKVEVKFLSKIDDNTQEFCISEKTYFNEQIIRLNSNSELKSFLSYASDLAYKNSRNGNKIEIINNHLYFNLEEVEQMKKDSIVYEKNESLYRKLMNCCVFTDNTETFEMLFKI